MVDVEQTSQDLSLLLQSRVKCDVNARGNS